MTDSEWNDWFFAHRERQFQQEFARLDLARLENLIPDQQWDEMVYELCRKFAFTPIEMEKISFPMKP